MLRLVISWFGCDIVNLKLISQETFSHWLRRVQDLVAARGWQIERLGSAIDLIIGCPRRSISPFAFFAFQRQWEKLNEEFGLRFGGVLALAAEGEMSFPNMPWEIYIKGRKAYGDSIGRPQRHRAGTRESRGTKEAALSTDQPTPIFSAAPAVYMPLGDEARLVRLSQPSQTYEEVMAQTDKFLAHQHNAPDLDHGREDKELL